MAYERETGLMDLKDLEERLKSGDVAAVFYENPSYLGFFETRGEKIAELAHKYGALCIAQPEVAALGVMESPMNQAPILCAEISSLWGCISSTAAARRDLLPANRMWS